MRAAMMGGLKTVGLRCKDGDFEIFTGQMESQDGAV